MSLEMEEKKGVQININIAVNGRKVGLGFMVVEKIEKTDDKVVC